jgi:2-C-methyl-D-erythritol 4-phosphate cytidylyltransferase / 2-C-methyl-D-erythritol 2,4-cyclodiphosphate synthase
LPEPAKVSLIVAAAGRGSRAGDGEPKQYRLCAGRPLLCRTLEALTAAHDFCATTVVIHPEDAPRYERAVASLSRRCAGSLGPATFGGATRQASVRAGLEAQAPLAPQLVLIHDGARAFPSTPLIERAIAAAARYGAAAPGTRLNDTIKEIGEDGAVNATPPRAALRAVQTPQSFRFDLILAAHRQAARAGVDDLTDDAAVAEWAGRRTYVFEGEPGNVKITTLEDLQQAEARLLDEAADIRVGQGFDVHAFAPGDHVWLGGVRIPHSQALAGHSDADAALHAITDALLGAIGEGDIGTHFPPSDARWRGAASQLFLRDAIQRVWALNGIVAHIDATIVCEAPRIGPVREAMRARIAEIAGLDIGRVGVKATTSEGLGFTGRGEGVACLATATVRLPRRRQ